jgi:hypothetical protein
MAYITILTQDDAAPDAAQTFDKDFLNLVGISKNEFIKNSVHKIDFEAIRYFSSPIRHACNYKLEYAADYPFFVLYKWSNPEMTRPTKINYDLMTAQELINFVDRSDPAVKALAVKLEIYINGTTNALNAITDAIDEFDATHGVQ